MHRGLRGPSDGRMVSERPPEHVSYFPVMAARSPPRFWKAARAKALVREAGPSEPDRIRLHPLKARKGRLNRTNAREGRQAARAFEPFEKAAERIETTKRPGVARTMSWILHPDERVPILLMRFHPHLLATGERSRMAFYLRLFAHRAVGEARARGEAWTPMLDALARNLVTESLEPDETKVTFVGTEEDPQGVRLHFMGSEMAYSLMEDLEAWDEHGGEMEWINEEAWQWLERFEGTAGPSGEAPGDEEAYTPRDVLDQAREAAEVLIEAGRDEPRRLHPLTRGLAPFVWTQVGLEARRAGFAKAELRDERWPALVEVLAEAGAEPAAFYDPPPVLPDLRPDEQASALEAPEDEVRALVGALAPRVAHDLRRLLDRRHALPTPHRASPEAGRIRGLLSAYHLYRASRDTRDELRTEGYRLPEWPAEELEGPAYGSPLLMEGVLGEEEIEEVVAVLAQALGRTPPQTKAAADLVRRGSEALAGTLALAGRDVGEDHLLRLMDAPQGQDDSALLRPSLHERLLEHPGRSPRVIERILEENRAARVRYKAASDPIAVADEGLLERLTQSRAPDTHNALARTIKKVDLEEGVLVRVLRAFIRNAPELAIDLLETRPELKGQMNRRDLARLLASDSQAVRREAVRMVDALEIGPEPRGEEPSANRAAPTLKA